MSVAAARASTTGTLDILDRLVGFPTVSHAPNRDLIAFVRDLLAARGIAAELFETRDGRKANLFATIGPLDRPGILLSGHSDVVPGDGQAWTSDPFRMRVADGRAYGRGTADMKGFLACALALADRAAAQPLATPIHLAISHDEEIGCVGVRSMIAGLAGRPVRPRFAIVGEPTGMRVAIGHKGKIAARATCRGLAGHSALAPRALNAIHLACDVIGAVRGRQALIARDGARDEAYAIPYTTLHVGRIEGGTALNIVPDRCTVDFEIRNLAEDDPNEILGAIGDEAERIAARGRATAAEADIALDVVNGYPGLSTAPDAEVVRFARSITDPQDLVKVPFGTEAGLFAEGLGVPAVVCGPGSMDQGHRPDEFITLDQLDACDRMLERLLERCRSI